MKHLHMIANYLNINIMILGEPKSEEKLASDIINAIAKLKLESQTAKQEAESVKRAQDLDRRIEEQTSGMTPWEKQKYFDSWAGGFS